MGFSTVTAENMIAAAIAPLLLQIKTLQKELMTLRMSNLQLETRFSLLERRNDDSEQYSQRLNLIVDGIKVRGNETPDDIKDKVLNEIDNLGIEIDDLEIDRAHRIERPSKDQRGNLHQPVIVRFISWGARNLLYQARKRSALRMRPHLTGRREKILQDARDKIEKYDHVREAVDFVFVDRNCKLQAKCTDGRLLGFSSETEFDSVVNFVNGRTKYNKIHPRYEQKYNQTYFNPNDIVQNLPLATAEDDGNASTLYSNVASPGSPTKLVTENLWLPKVINSKGSDISLLTNSLYVGRPTKWGNPFKMDINSRALCVAKYISYVRNSYLFLQLDELLKYDYLICSCHPSLCHIDGLLKLLKDKYL